jgi:hypothetical protein
MESPAFGAAGFVVKLPKKATAIFAAEISQQPRHPISCQRRSFLSIAYAVRLSPAPESLTAIIDFGVA